ncbi:hypothetical protein CUR178_05208 [Leishmania enriettii]|uniref:Flagellar attachment zone protein 1 conserved domain-containing protein n=1 Tax=Leishmania enriettii TaxID=5663 RepID=A0A836GRB6_LEIEN|nr:hypothetical protein CUR178_05208 [Leishmania enriettii]
MPESTLSSMTFRETLQSRSRPDDKRRSEESVSISIREEPTVDEPSPQRRQNDISVNIAPGTSTQQDDIDSQIGDELASKSERSLLYQLENSRSASRLQSNASPELFLSAPREEEEESAASPPPSRPSGAAALRESAGPAALSKEEGYSEARPLGKPEGAAGASAGAQVGVATADAAAYPLYPPPRRLSRRAAAAAQMSHYRTSAPMTPSNRSPSSTYRLPEQQQRQASSEMQADAALPLVRKGVREPSPETATFTTWQPDVRTSTISEISLQEEPTAVDDAPAPAPGVPRSAISDAVVTEHTQYFPGREWENVVASSLDIIKQTVASETAAAVGVQVQRVQVMNVEATAAGMACVISVGHAPGMTTSEVDEKLSSCRYEKTMMLLGVHGVRSILDTSEGTSTAVERPKGTKRGAATEGKSMAKKRKRVNGMQGAAKEGISSGAYSEHASAAYARKKALKGLPLLLVTPRNYQCRLPRPGAEHSMDRLAISYTADPREATDGLGGSGSGRAPTRCSESIADPAHIPPQHIQRGVAPLVFLPRSNIAAPAQQRTKAAPTGGASAYHFNGVEHSADTRSVSRRSHSRSPQQLALAPEADPAPYEDDYALMSQGVEEVMDDEGAKQQQQHTESADAEDCTFSVAAPNPFV